MNAIENGNLAATGLQLIVSAPDIASGLQLNSLLRQPVFTEAPRGVIMANSLLGSIQSSLSENALPLPFKERQKSISHIADGIFRNLASSCSGDYRLMDDTITLAQTQASLESQGSQKPDRNLSKQIAMEDTGVILYAVHEKMQSEAHADFLDIHCDVDVSRLSAEERKTGVERVQKVLAVTDGQPLDVYEAASKTKKNHILTDEQSAARYLALQVSAAIPSSPISFDGEIETAGYNDPPVQLLNVDPQAAISASMKILNQAFAEDPYALAATKKMFAEALVTSDGDTEVPSIPSIPSEHTHLEGRGKHDNNSRLTRAQRVLVIGLVGAVVIASGVALYEAAHAAPRVGNTINVNANCNLQDAILAANTNTPQGGCPAGSPSGTDNIMLPAGIIEFSSPNYYPTEYTGSTSGTALPPVTSSINIIGESAANTTIQRSPTGSDTRLLFVANGADLGLQNLSIKNGRLMPGIGNSPGGAIYADTGSIIRLNGDVSFTNNAAHYGGAIFTYQGNLESTGATFTGNSVLVEGGAIKNLLGNVKIVSSNFYNNSAGTGYDGGAILSWGQTDIKNSTFQSGTAGRGAGIEAAGNLTITNSIFINGYANRGGAIVFGGAVNGIGGSALIDGVFLNGNNATDTGGALVNNAHNPGEKMTIRNSTITVNYAGLFGGAIGNYGNLYVEGSTLSGNWTPTYGQGGAIANRYLFDSVYLNIDRTTLDNNIAYRGGGIYIAPNTSASILNSTISSNSAGNPDGGGGGLRIEGPTYITNTTIYSNTASLGAGSQIAVDTGQGQLFSFNNIFGNKTSAEVCIGGSAINTRGGNVITGGSCNLTHTSDKPNTDPLLGPLQNNGGSTLKTHATQSGSPANTSGLTVSIDGSPAPTVDEIMATRPGPDNKITSGAKEYDGVLPPTPTPRPTNTPTPTPYKIYFPYIKR